MTTIVRAARPATDFEIVPRARLRDTRLSFGARGLLERMLSNTDGWQTDAARLADESPTEGRGRILAYLRELRGAGYLRTERCRDARGRIRTQNLLHDAPATGVEKPDAGVPDAGPPASGAPPRKEVPISKSKEQKHARAGARGPEQPARAAAEKSQDAEPAARHGVLRHGVLCWTDDDRVEAERLAQEHGSKTLRAAGAAVRADGLDPLPSRVAAEIEQRQKAKLAGMAAAEAGRRMLRIEALGRIQADLRLGLITQAEAAAAAQKLGIT